MIKEHKIDILNLKKGVAIIGVPADPKNNVTLKISTNYLELDQFDIMSITESLFK